LALLKKYTERYYTFRKREWELPHLEYRNLEADDPNFLGVAKDSSENGLLPHPDRQVAGGDRRQARRTEDLDQNGELKPWEFQGMKAIGLAASLPAAALSGSNIVEISPAPLNKANASSWKT
jgi:hypothetical protein